MSKLSDIVSQLSPRERMLLEQRLQQKRKNVLSQEILPRKELNNCPLSFAQQRLWFVDQLEPGRPLYNVALAMQISGVLNAPALQRTINAVVARHEILRTTFVAVSGEPVQRISEASSVAMSTIDISHLTESERGTEAPRLVKEECGRAFDLTQGPLFRVTLLKLGELEHILLFSMHHIIFDGWSVSVLLRELATLYGGFLRGKPSPLPPLPIQYADYAVWQRDWLEGEVLDRQLSYWRKRLANAPIAKLPVDHERPHLQSFRSARQSITLSRRLTEQLNELGRREGVTLFMTLLAAFQVLLYRYSGQEDIVVGTDVANRNRVETEKLIGFFVNHLVLRTDLSGNPTFLDLLLRVKDVTLGAYANQDAPFDKLVEVLHPERSLSYTPLFQVLFVLQNTLKIDLKLSGLTSTYLPVTLNESAKYDLTLFIEEKEPSVIVTWRYKTALFEAATINRMTDRFAKLLENILAQPDARIDTFEMLSETERKQEALEKRERQDSQIRKLRGIKRKAVDLSSVRDVKTTYLRPGETLPLVIQPEMEEIDLADWAASNRDFIETKLLSHGAILFRGFDPRSVAKFEQFAQAVCPELFGEYGDLPRESAGGKVYGSTPYPAEETILFHNESSHMHRWPMKIWFFCQTAAEQGGETPIIDCRKVYQLMAPGLRQDFAERQLMYVRNYTDGLDVSWQRIFQTTDKSEVEEHCRKAGIEFEWKDGNRLRTRQICPAVLKHPQTGEWVFFNQIQLHHASCLEAATRASLLSMMREEDLPRNVYYGDGTPIEDSVVDEIRKLYQRTAVSFSWQAGDILMLNNMLTAHSRNPFVGPRKIVVAMGEMINKEEIQGQ